MALSERTINNIERTVSQIIHNHNSIGISKSDSAKNSEIIGAHGQKTSENLHSIKYMLNSRNELTNLAIFAKEYYNLKIHQINIKTIKTWLQSKDISKDTASTYIAEIARFSNEFKNLSREAIINIRGEQFYKDLRVAEQEPRAYNVNKIDINLMKDTIQISYELQRDYGLRISEATSILIRNDTLQIKNIYTKADVGLYPNQNMLIYSGKSGKIGEKELTPTLTSKIVENASQGKFEINNRTYARHLEKAIKKSGQEYNGTHGLRHSYAQNQLRAGAPKADVSKEMNHEREDIINTYLR